MIRKMKFFYILGIKHSFIFVWSIYLGILVQISCEVQENGFLGCFKYEEKGRNEGSSNRTTCIFNCQEKKLKYAILSASKPNCYCSDSLEDLGDRMDVLSSTGKCMEYSVYSVDKTLANSPRYFKVVSLSDDGVKISWEKPDNSENVLSYEILSTILHTYSIYPIQNTTWVYSNNTFKTTLKLQPGSKFQLSIRARSAEGLGLPTSLILETPIGMPDNPPPIPDILSRTANTMKIKVHPTINNNGPISSYQVIVFDKSAKQIFQPEYLENYQDSLVDGLNYYITAELLPEHIEHDLIVGDGKFYGKYFNAPLIPSLHYTCLVSLVSTLNNVTKIAYSNFSITDMHINVLDFDYNIDNNTSYLQRVLIALIFVVIVLLIGSIILFLILRRNVALKHRHDRLSEQELALQGPMISFDNSAYLMNEDQCPSDYYNSLKQQVHILSFDDDFTLNDIIGRGKYGTVYKAVPKESNPSVSWAAYCISDKNLPLEDKRFMLKNLDMLVKCNKHANIVELIGVSESSHMLYIVLKLFPVSLKKFLINSRKLNLNRFCELPELTILSFISQITNGILELEKNNINHTKLCATNILLDDNLVPKISGFGLADIVMDKEQDYTRWSAVEILRGQNVNPRSMIWSFGILIWEICALGATPYSNLTNNSEVIEKITKGIRLPQLKYFNDDLYQIMLNCWQVTVCERPNSTELSKFVEDLNECSIIPFISFNRYQAFEYEKYEPELELLCH